MPTNDYNRDCNCCSIRGDGVCGYDTDGNPSECGWYTMYGDQNAYSKIVCGGRVTCDGIDPVMIGGCMDTMGYNYNPDPTRSASSLRLIKCLKILRRFK